MIAFHHVTLRRGPNKLIEDINLRLPAGQRVGIVGRNGCGKTSLFQLLQGELSPDTGELDLPRGLEIATVRQQTPSGRRSALDFVLDGDAELRRVQRQIETAERENDGNALAHLHAHMATIDGYAATARAARLLRGLGFAPDTHDRPIDAFSGGWRMRLNLAAALMHRCDLLLLDEPTNHLDMDTVLWLQAHLNRHPATLLIISHDRDFLDATTQQTLHLSGGRATLYSGNYSAFETMRAEAMLQQQATYEAQQKRLAELHKFVDRFRAKATKARQAQSRLKQIEKMEVVEAAHWDTPFSFSFLEPKRMPVTLLQLDKVNVGYAGTPLVSRIRLRLAAGDRVAILGRNGAGKSTVMKLLAGVLAPLTGEVRPDRYLKVGYFAQHQVEDLDVEASPALHLQRLDPQANEQRIRDFLGGFGFHGDQALAPVGPFSGGEKARLALALIVYARPNLLLLDEPTNHLDLDMRHALEVALQGYPGAVLLVAHDRHLIDATCEQLWHVHAGLLQAFDGDMDDYANWLSRQAADSQNEASVAGKTRDAAPPGSGDSRKSLVRQRAREKPLRQAVARAEREMNTLEKKLATLEAELANPAVYERPEEVTRLSRTQGQLQEQLEAAEVSWMEHAEALQALRQEVPLS